MTKNELIQTLAGIIKAQNPQACEAIRALLLEAERTVNAPECPVPAPRPAGVAYVPPAARRAFPSDVMLLDFLSSTARNTSVRLAYSLDRQIFRATTAGKTGEGATLREAIKRLLDYEG